MDFMFLYSKFNIIILIEPVPLDKKRYYISNMCTLEDNIYLQLI